jgi:lysine-specific demethylase 3
MIVSRSDPSFERFSYYAVLYDVDTQTPREPSDNISWSGGMTKELQATRCMSQRYKDERFPRCVACTRRWAGDTCRFQGVRFLLRDSEKRVVATSFVELHQAVSPKLMYPTKWSGSLKKQDIETTKV